MRQCSIVGFTSVLFSLLISLNGSAQALPQWHHDGQRTQLYIDNQPFLMLGVQPDRALFDDPRNLPLIERQFALYTRAGVNTALLPIWWKQLEPIEDHYDFTMIDALIEASRKHNLKLVVQWYGLFYNGGLDAAPWWFKNQLERLLLAQKPDGSKTPSISPFSQKAMQSAREALVHLMQRIQQKDPDGDVVILLQLEDQIGYPKLNDARDSTSPANQAWNKPVPQPFMDYLLSELNLLHPWLRDVWHNQDRKIEGTWPEVFGDNNNGNQVFMAYHTAKFLEQLAQAGREVHPLPMFVNAAPHTAPTPNTPIGMPNAQTLDIWRHATPSIEAFAPAIDQKTLKTPLLDFMHRGNPILLPAALPADGRLAAYSWYAFAQHQAVLFAPHLPAVRQPATNTQNAPPSFSRTSLNISYPMLANMKNILFEKQGVEPKPMIAFVTTPDEGRAATYQDELQGFSISTQAMAAYPKQEEKPVDMIPPFAVIIHMAENEFVVIGSKMYVQFYKPGLYGANVHLGQFIDSQWKQGRKIYVTNLIEEHVVEFTLTAGKTDIQQMRLKLSLSEPEEE